MNKNKMFYNYGRCQLLKYLSLQIFITKFVYIYINIVYIVIHATLRCNETI